MSTQELERKLSNQKDQITQLISAVKTKNLQLDALHHVWCTGCDEGCHRHSEGELTEELVATAEREVARMREWLRQYHWRHAP